MTRADLGRLGDAIKSNDFSNFVSHTSLTYQSQHTNQSTQQAFKQFVDNNVDLEKYLAGDMVLTSEPSISSQGTLTLHGRYGTVAGALGFDLAYVNAERQWTLSGVKIATLKTTIAEDSNLSIDALQKAADSGNAQAQNLLANRLVDGDGVAKNEKEAVKWYRTAADQGYARAQNNLGVIYDQGIGVPQDQAEAAVWYRKAAEQGYAMAQNNLGLMLSNGIGVKKNPVDAASWYQKAADQEFAQAQYNLGHAFAIGSGVKKNRSQAEVWLRKAADQGDAQALAELNAINSNHGGGKAASP
jgi:TPR repeat protein